MPDVIDLRLRICIGAEFWAMGDEVVRVLARAKDALLGTPGRARAPKGAPVPTDRNRRAADPRRGRWGGSRGWLNSCFSQSWGPNSLAWFPPGIEIKRYRPMS